MKKILILSLFILFSFSATYSQESTATVSQNTVFAEFLGPGFASFNYERRFSKEPGGFGARIGMGGFYIDDVGIFTLPIGANYLIGKNNKDFFELGLGWSFISGGDRTNNDFSSTSFGYLHFGYRYQPTQGGINFRAGLTPLFRSNWFWPILGSISIGYTF